MTFYLFSIGMISFFRSIKKKSVQILSIHLKLPQRNVPIFVIQYTLCFLQNYCMTMDFGH